MTASSAFESPQPIERPSDYNDNSGLSHIALDLLKESRLSANNKVGSLPEELTFNFTGEHAFMGEMPTGGPPDRTRPIEPRAIKGGANEQALAPLNGYPILRPRPGSQHPTQDSVSVKDGNEMQAAVAPLDGNPILRPRPGSQHPTQDSVSRQNDKEKVATWSPNDKDPLDPGQSSKNPIKPVA